MGWKTVGSSSTGASYFSNYPTVNMLRYFFESDGDIDIFLVNTNKDYELRTRNLRSWSYGKTYRIRLSVSGETNFTAYTSSRYVTGATYFENVISSRTLKGACNATYYLEEYVDDPAIPSSLSVPSLLKPGQSFTVSWGTSSSPGGGSISYQLERSVNSGSYSTVYSGISTSFVDTVQEAWETVSYRVRASDNWGYSSYRTSDIIKITRFPELSININGGSQIAEKGWVKIDGELKEIEGITIRVNGELKEVI